MYIQTSYNMWTKKIQLSFIFGGNCSPWICTETSSFYPNHFHSFHLLMKWKHDHWPVVWLTKVKQEDWQIQNNLNKKSKNWIDRTRIKRENNWVHFLVNPIRPRQISSIDFAFSLKLLIMPTYKKLKRCSKLEQADSNIWQCPTANDDSDP